MSGMPMPPMDMTYDFSTRRNNSSSAFGGTARATVAGDARQGGDISFGGTATLFGLPIWAVTAAALLAGALLWRRLS